MPYALRESAPTVDRFLELRAAAGMAERAREAVERGLPNSQYAVTVVETATETTVGMARIVGDGGTVYHVCDMAVHPDHQRQGLGSRLMDALMAWIHETAAPTAYVNLMADVDGFYEQWGFERTLRRRRGCSTASSRRRRRFSHDGTRPSSFTRCFGQHDHGNRFCHCRLRPAEDHAPWSG